MALYRKKGNPVWYAEVYVRETGKRLCVSTRKRDRAEAEEVERLLRLANNRKTDIEYLHALVDTLYGADCGGREMGLSVAGAYEAYKDAVAASGRTVSAHTLASRRNSLSKFKAWIDETHPAIRRVNEVTRMVAGSYAKSVASAKGLSDKTKHEAISNLGTAWNVLMGIDETIRENPWRYFRTRVATFKKGVAFTGADVARILDACRGTEWELASLISLWTGLRLGDVCALRWEEVDFSEGVIRASPSKTRRHGIKVAIPLSAELADALARGGVSEGPILPGLCAAYPHPERAPCGPFSAVLERAGLKGRRFHDFRHTFASRLADAGASTDAIKKLGGWNVDATALRYQHSDRIGELREAIQAVERVQRNGREKPSPKSSSAADSSSSVTARDGGDSLT